jgi:predicted RNA-binding protein YlxR (DUF448 family)
MESKPKGELIRVAFYEGKISLDETGRARGRGAYLCRNPECFDKAEKRRAFNRAFRSDIDRRDIEALMEEIRNEQE